MNHRIARIGVSALTVPALAVLFLGFAVEAQSPEPPPVKMGLWQTEVTTHYEGVENTPMARMGGAHTTVSQSCLTPEKWRDGWTKMRQGPHSQDCQMTNMHFDAQGITFDETCSSEGFNTTMHFEGQFDGESGMHGTGTAHATGAAFPQGMTVHVVMNSKFLSSDCGDVKPGEGKVIH